MVIARSIEELEHIMQCNQYKKDRSFIFGKTINIKILKGQKRLKDFELKNIETKTLYCPDCHSMNITIKKKIVMCKNCYNVW